MNKVKSVFMFIFVLLSLILLLYLSATVLGHLSMPQLFLLGLSILILVGAITARGKSE
jgi:hypothetical protein